MTTETITGTIEAISVKSAKQFAVKINNEWYNSFGSCKLEKGNIVTIEYNVNGDFKNANKITLQKNKIIEAMQDEQYLDGLETFLKINDKELSIILGQAQNLSLQLQLREMEMYKKPFNWNKYISDTNLFFNANMKMQREIKK